MENVIHPQFEGRVDKEKKNGERETKKKCNNATLIAYELKTKVFFVATIFPLPIIRRHALKYEKSLR